MDELLLAVCFAIAAIAKGKHLSVYIGLIVPIILWISVCYPYYRQPQNGYRAMREMQHFIKQGHTLPKDFFYFTDNDTKMHYELMDKFNQHTEYIALDTSEQGLVPFRQYQPEEMFKDKVMFRPGWMIINPDYTPMSRAQLDSIYVLFGQPEKTVGDVRAFYMSSPAQLQTIMFIVNSVKTVQVPCGCNLHI